MIGGSNNEGLYSLFSLIILILGIIVVILLPFLWRKASDSV